MTESDLEWCLWVALAHHPRDARRAVITNRVIPADDLLARWLDRDADDAAIAADISVAFGAGACKQSALPAGLRIEVTPLPLGLAVGWGFEYGQPWSAADVVCDEARLVAIARRLLARDDPPSAPVRPAATDCLGRRPAEVSHCPGVSPPARGAPDHPPSGRRSATAPGPAAATSAPVYSGHGRDAARGGRSRPSGASQTQTSLFDLLGEERAC